MLDANVSDARVIDDLVQVSWADGSHSGFHAVWLYDNCPSRMHPKTWERTADISSIDLELQARVVRAKGSRLQVSWSNGESSDFDADFLYRHRYDEVEAGGPDEGVRLWDRSIAADLPDGDYATIMESDDGLLDLLTKVRDSGFAVVRNMPAQEWACEDIAFRVAFTRETNFGRRFNVVSMPDPNNQAYTHDALAAHTDLANREMPPGVQFLHCLEFDATGGESVLVDGFYAAEELRALDRQAWELLTRTPVSHRFHDAEWDLRWKAPAIALDDDGRYREIRYNPGLAAPLNVRPDLVKQTYRALKAYSNCVTRDENQLLFRLRPGDMMVFNNRRVLHGRAAFNPNTGPRRLQGVYVDLDEWLSRIRVLTQEHLQH